MVSKVCGNEEVCMFHILELRWNWNKYVKKARDVHWVRWDVIPTLFKCKTYRKYHAKNFIQYYTIFLERYTTFLMFSFFFEIYPSFFKMHHIFFAFYYTT